MKKWWQDTEIFAKWLSNAVIMTRAVGVTESWMDGLIKKIENWSHMGRFGLCVRKYNVQGARDIYSRCWQFLLLKKTTLCQKIFIFFNY